MPGPRRPLREGRPRPSATGRRVGSVIAGALLTAATAAIAAPTPPSFDRVFLPDRLDLPRPVALADVTGDKIPDIVMGSSTGLFVMKGDGGGVFTNWQRANEDEYLIGGAASADFDEDGCPDVVAGGSTDSSGTAASRVLRIYRCSGGGRYERIYERRANVLRPLAGDFNGDGHADVVVGLSEWYADPLRGGQFRGVVEVMLGDGRGNFSAPIRTVYGEPDTSASFRYVADFNHDGRDDLLLYTGAVLLADGSGTFAAPLRMAVPDLPHDAIAGDTLNMSDVASGDLNGDGNVDLVVRWFYAARESGNPWGVERGLTTIHLGDGAGGFSAPAVLAEPAARRRGDLSQLLVDTDRDGNLDLVLSGTSSYDYDSPYNLLGNNSPIEVYRGHGDGTFEGEPVVSYDCGGEFISDFLFKRVSRDLDFDGDGRRDLLLTTGHAMRVVFGDGKGGFSEAHDYGGADHSTAAGAAIGDFDGDGDNDIAVGNEATANVSIWLSDGAGAFTGPRNFPVAWRQGPVAVVAADIDGDGRLDLAVAAAGDAANGFDDGVSVLKGDGHGAFAEPKSLAVPAAGDIAVVDIDRDGHPDLAVVDGRQRVVWIVRDPLGTAGVVGYADPVDTRDNLWNSYAFVDTEMAVADFDEDGWPDIARTSRSGQINVFFDLGASLQRVVKIPVLFDSRSMAAADLDGDGHADLAVGGVGARLAVLFGDGHGGFGAPVTSNLLADTITTNVAAGDLDGSGRAAVIASFYDRTTLGYPDASGALGSITDIGAGIVSMHHLALGDVDSDGRPDLVASQLVFLNRGSCGDGRKDAGEDCDDGNVDDCDGCSGGCRRETGFVCGDGSVNAACGEECDDGSANGAKSDACRMDCLRPRCGDAVVDSGEECDDGNAVSCDGCSTACTLDPAPVCGDGVSNGGCGESCDDGNGMDGDGCSADCRLELIPGGGSPHSDCLLEWKVINPGNRPFEDSRGAISSTQSCRDGDPACDFDVAPGQCTFRLATCASVDDPNLDGSCAAVTLRRLDLRRPAAGATGGAGATDEARAALSRAAAATVGAAFGQCSPWADVPVTRPEASAGQLLIKAKAYGDARMTDSDTLKLVCLP